MFFGDKVVFLQFENEENNMMRYLMVLMALLFYRAGALAEEYPEAFPRMWYYDTEGLLVEGDESYSGGAPFEAHFSVDVENVGDYYPLYEWQFRKDGQEAPFLTRYDAETEYRFTESGTFYVQCFVSFVHGKDTLEYEMDTPFIINIANSKLEVPNAFTPNDDGINDVFKVKDGYESIVEFHAAVFSRAGKKLYEWTDPADGWDGTMNGHGGAKAPDGAYYFVMKARGADGLKYDRKMTINLLRGYNESATGGGK